MGLCTILLYLFLFSFVAISQDLEKNLEIGPVISFAEDEAHLGEAMEGEVLEYTFKFENTGKDALIITNVLTSCGCTITEWPREPIYPSRKGEITVKFDTSNKIGLQSKSLIILSNSVNVKDEIKLIANVISGTAAKISP